MHTVLASVRSQKPSNRVPPVLVSHGDTPRDVLGAPLDIQVSHHLHGAGVSVRWKLEGWKDKYMSCFVGEKLATVIINVCRHGV